MEKSITRTIRIATGTAVCINLYDEVVKKEFWVPFNRKTIVKDVATHIESMYENLTVVRISEMRIYDANYEMPMRVFMDMAKLGTMKEVNSLEA